MDRGFADAHVHAAEAGFSGRYPDAPYAEVMFACTARPSEWDAVASCGAPGIVRFYGVHPWYADEWDDSVRERLESILGSDPRAHVGEIGMDSKRGDPSVQRPVLDAQLDLASARGRMANIHMVGCEKDVLEAVRAHGRGCTPIIHSFSAESYVKPFADAGCMFSLNPRILARSEERVRSLVSRIPEDRLLLETDAPYVTSHFTGMLPFAERLAGIMGWEADRLLSVTLENARRAADV